MQTNSIHPPTTPITDLDDATIATLQDLVRINLDSAEGFRTAAERIENEALAGFFRECGEERARFGEQLRQYVEINDEDARDTGSIAGQLHRWWIDLRGMVQGGDEHAILAEAERGEDRIKALYEKALKDHPATPVTDVLGEQYRRVKHVHDTVRDMRDARA